MKNDFMNSFCEIRFGFRVEGVASVPGFMVWGLGLRVAG